MNVREFRYDESEQVLFVSFRQRLVLTTSQDVDAFFDESYEYWQKHIRKRVYYVVDISELEIHAQVVEAYSRNVKRMLKKAAITVVRYGGSPLQRTATRLATMKLHVPSHIYSTREEAIAVVRGLRAGTIQLADRP